MNINNYVEFLNKHREQIFIIGFCISKNHPKFSKIIENIKTEDPDFNPSGNIIPCYVSLALKLDFNSYIFFDNPGLFIPSNYVIKTKCITDILEPDELITFRLDENDNTGFIEEYPTEKAMNKVDFAINQFINEINNQDYKNH